MYMCSMYFSISVAELLWILLQRALHTYACTVPYFYSFRNVTLHSAVHCLRVTSVCGQRQQSENSSAALPSITIKHHVPKHVTAKLWLRETSQINRQHAALRAEGKKTEGRKFQYQPVDLGVWHDMSFSFFPLVLLTYPREKALFYL